MSLSNRALELPRGALRPLRGSGFALGQPDAFISPGRQAVREAEQGCAGAFPLRSFAPLNDFAYVDRSIWVCDCVA